MCHSSIKGQPAFDYFRLGDWPVVMDRSSARAFLWSLGIWQISSAIFQTELREGDLIDRVIFLKFFPDAPLEELGVLRIPQ